MLMAILGRQPEFGYAELIARLGAPNVIYLNARVALIADTAPAVDWREFGSVVKVAELTQYLDGLTEKTIADFADSQLADIPGKITLGVSAYNAQGVPDAKAVHLAEKSLRLSTRANGISLRLVPSTGALNAAAVRYNHLGGRNPKKQELILALADPDSVFAERKPPRAPYRWAVGRTIYIQDIAAYTERDRARPKRDARVGMLPPKLAQTMINLARGARPQASHPGKNETNTPLLLDPFCGTGVVLQEAALMGCSILGTDLEPRMIDFTRANLAWLKTQYQTDFSEQLAVGDATDYQWPQPLDLVATETYLGQPFATEPSADKLREVMNGCNTIITKFLMNLHGQITESTGLCIAVPCWFTRAGAQHLPLVQNLAKLGFEQIFYSDQQYQAQRPGRLSAEAKFPWRQTPLIYHRPDQVVGRELLVLRKTHQPGTPHLKISSDLAKQLARPLAQKS
jgi:tRNA G10  N-methylase Trm11